jgi:phosphatidylglycerol---prolipoprotein diacylglyceryl transferase
MIRLDNSCLGVFVWDPSPEMFHFHLPFLDRPILWYGFFFAFGFFVGYFVLSYLLRRYFLSLPQERKKEALTIKQKTTQLADQLTLYVIVGAIVGARLGDVLFYQDWREIASDPLSVFAVWKGGLASHGGAAGILIALGFLARKRKIPFWTAVDFTVIPTALAAVFIRIGNFFNQEILGVPTSLPWGIVFLHPADGGPLVPRHPAQLYEALGYLCVFAILLWVWHRNAPFKPIGKMTGLFLLLVFGSRFFIEGVKVEQSVYLTPSSFLTMGQWLSIPFVLLGAWLLLRAYRHGFR